MKSEQRPCNPFLPCTRWPCHSEATTAGRRNMMLPPAIPAVPDPSKFFPSSSSSAMQMSNPACPIQRSCSHPGERMLTKRQYTQSGPGGSAASARLPSGLATHHQWSPHCLDAGSPAAHMDSRSGMSFIFVPGCAVWSSFQDNPPLL